MTDGDPAGKWLYFDGVRTRFLPLSELLEAQTEADKVSKRIRTEGAKSEQTRQQPAAREPERPAENPPADTQPRKQIRLSITIKSSQTQARELLQSLELSHLVFMPRLHDCERTLFADVKADERLQAAVKAGRRGGWVEWDGLKWKANRAMPKRQSSRGGQPQSRTPPSAADRAPAATGGWGTGASQRLFPKKADEMQGVVAEMSKMLQQFTETMMNLQQKNQPPEATSTPAAAQAEIEQLRQELATTKENAKVAAHTAAVELLELRRLLHLARTEIGEVQDRLQRLERPLQTRQAAPSKKAVHPRFGGRPTPEKSPVFAPTTPGQPHTATPAGAGTGQPLQTPGMPFQFGPPKPQVPATEQPATPQQMPLATVPEATTAAATPEAPLVRPQLATPPHPEGQSSTKRQASPGTMLSPLRPRQVFKESTETYRCAYRAESYDNHWVDRSDASDTDQFFDGSVYTPIPTSSHSDPTRPSAISERMRPSPKPP